MPSIDIFSAVLLYKGKKSVEYNVLYDITGGAINFLAQTGTTEIGYGIALDDERLRLDSVLYEYDSSNGTLKKVGDKCESLGLWIKYGTNLYRLNGNRVSYIEKYSFSDSDYNTISDYIYRNCIGKGKTAFYFYNNDKFTKVSVIDGQTEELKINTSDKDVEFADMGRFDNFYKLMFIIDDNTMIFYDDNMKAFRILEKNK